MQQGSSTSAGAAGATATLTDEQILGLEPTGAAADASLRADESAAGAAGDDESILATRPEARRDSANRDTGARNDGATDTDTAEPAWLRALEAQPEAAAEARRWRQAAIDAAALDADYFSAAPGARAGLAARLHADDPSAFRAMLADAARVLAERDPQGLAELARQLGGGATAAASGKSLTQAARRDSSGLNRAPQNDSVNAGASADDVARQVRDSINRSLAATLPDGIADGARRRIGEDIFRDLSAVLSTDRELSGQIGELLRGWRFDAATRQQLAGLLAGRARKALPEVARRVVSEWTSSVLASDRAKQTRIASAASRRDITGGRLPEPVASSALRPRRVDYTRTSDEQILEM